MAQHTKPYCNVVEPIGSSGQATEDGLDWFFPPTSMSDAQVRFVFQRLMPGCQLFFDIQELGSFLQGTIGFAQHVLGHSLSDYESDSKVAPVLSFPRNVSLQAFAFNHKDPMPSFLF